MGSTEHQDKLLEDLSREVEDSSQPPTKKKHNTVSIEQDGSSADCRENELQIKGFDFANPKKVEEMTKVNQFGIRKRVAQCMIDLALFAANISQLRIIIKAGSENVEFYYFLLVCVSLSLAGQIVFAVIIIIILERQEQPANVDIESDTPAVNSETDGKTVWKDKVVNALNCLSVFLVLGVTLIKVAISGFIEIKHTITSESEYLYTLAPDN